MSVHRRIVVVVAAASLVGAAETGVSDGLGEASVSASVLSRVDRSIEENVDGWVEFYKHCHANPELSLQEEKTSARIAERLEQSGISVTRKVGGHGVVGVLENGDGPTVLIRTDMDALPVTEETELPFDSRAEVTKEDGSKVGVMHACGHDMHMAVFTGVAGTLAEMKDAWNGTVVFIAQPAEEIGRGARMMIEAGLFERFPRPDYCLALHVKYDLKSGTIGYTPGWAFANVDSVDITIYGKGGHGASPHTTVDPIVTGAQLILALQTIVSRRLDPVESGVVTVGSFHAGTKHNVIPDEAQLQITVRSYNDKSRKLLLDSIRQIATDVCKAAQSPRPPKVDVLKDDFTPASFNDPELTAHCVEVFKGVVGEANCIATKPTMGTEDFGQYAAHLEGRGFMFWLGAIDEKRYEAAQKPGAEPLPSAHSAKFRVEPEATLRTGVRCMTAAALSLLD